ncbi:MAG: sirohydrochlorin cobaltochelatase [Clostridia bacterium]|nr:sirohydrochlorin cobaltochelatase [Clostridia bacterium]
MKKKILVLLGLAAVTFAMFFSGCSSTQNNSDGQNDEALQNADENKKAVLVVSFGTSYNESREKTIGAVEKKIADAFPDYDQKRAFTSQIIIDKINDRDGEKIDNVDEAMQKLVDEGYGTVVVQPTHVMNGEEYDEMKELTAPYENKFKSIKYGTPLLTSSDDYEKVIKAIAAETPQLEDKECAVVFMGHGTEHFANATYSALDYRFKSMGYDNAFVGTVESYPDLDKIKTDLANYNPKKVVLIPLMIVAGDHANNDMAGDEEDSWKTQLKKEGYEVECIIKGLGEYSGIQDMFVEHCNAAISNEEAE